jgi:hypothetical protein
MIQGTLNRGNSEPEKGIRLMRRNGTLFAGIATLALVFVLAAGAQAPVKVTGIWDITMGTIVRTLTLKQDGNKVTGSIKGPAGTFPFEDGVLDGNKLTFSIDLVVQGRKIHRAYAGTVDGQTITGTVNDGTNTNTFVAKPGPDRTYDPPLPAAPQQ